MLSDGIFQTAVYGGRIGAGVCGLTELTIQMEEFRLFHEAGIHKAEYCRGERSRARRTEKRKEGRKREMAQEFP